MLNASFLSCILTHPAAYWMSTQVPHTQHTQNNPFPSSCPQICSFPSVSCFNEQHIYPAAQARNLTLPSRLFLTPSQILSNFPHHFSNLFSYLLLIQSLSELRPVSSLTSVPFCLLDGLSTRQP